MKNPFASLFRARDKPGRNEKPTDSISSAATFYFGSSASGKSVTATTAIQMSTVYRILHDEPNTEMTSFILREVMLTHLLIYGNAYCQILRNGRGHILGLYPLLPEQMQVDRDDSGRLIYDYTTRESKVVRLRPEDVLHIPGLGFDGVMGYSPIALEKNAIGLGLAAEEYGSKFFSNGARPSGILTYALIYIS